AGPRIEPCCGGIAGGSRSCKAKDGRQLDRFDDSGDDNREQAKAATRDDAQQRAGCCSVQGKGASHRVHHSRRPGAEPVTATSGPPGPPAPAPATKPTAAARAAQTAAAAVATP
ncbi:unnamed protein product, partial [Sphacelaria rigidula]